MGLAVQKTWRRGGAATAALAALAACPAHAHEKWFINAKPYPLRWDLLFQPLPLAFVLATALATVIAAIWWKTRGRGFVPGPESLGATGERRSALYGLAPLILGIHVAVPLLVSGVNGALFSPNNLLPVPWNYAIGLLETAVALALFYGAFTRFAAVLLAALWVLGVFVVGFQPMLENIFYLGIAAFFFMAGRGPISVDRMVLPRLEPSARMMARAVPALRIGMGLSFVILAFTEKLANIPLALAFLDKYPLNFTTALGLPLSNTTFILSAGAVELVVGLWVLFNIFPREIILVTWLPLNLTLNIFSWKELIGHMPIYAILAVLLLWSPGPENLSLWISGMRKGPLAIPEHAGDS
jgi:uncharacterized membrane protein YphA (DoxX/SURF4 family)